MGTVITYGSETYLLQKQKMMFKAMEGVMDCNLLETVNPSEAVEHLMSISFFSAKMYCYLKVESLKEIGDKSFISFLELIKSDNTKILLIEVEGVRKNDKNIKVLSELAQFRVYEKYTSKADLATQVQKICAEKSVKMTPQALDVFLERTDYFRNDTVTLQTLANYIGQLQYLADEISEKQVCDVVPDLREAQRFALASYIVKGKRDLVFSEMRKLKAERDFSAIQLLSLLHREYRISYLAKLGFTPKQQNVWKDSCSDLTKEELVYGLNVITERLSDIKNGIYSEEEAFELCIIQLLARKGE